MRKEEVAGELACIWAETGERWSAAAMQALKTLLEPLPAHMKRKLSDQSWRHTGDKWAATFVQKADQSSDQIRLASIGAGVSFLPLSGLSSCRELGQPPGRAAEKESPALNAKARKTRPERLRR